MTRDRRLPAGNARPLTGERGYTLVELLVVMAIFLTVIIVASQGFKTVLTQVGQQSKLMETDIGNVVGLELFRSDLQNAGYGLPFTLRAAPSSGTYTEVTNSDTGIPVTAGFWPAGKSPASFNDVPASYTYDTDGAPRAVQSGNTTFNLRSGVGSQYLVIKSLTVADSQNATQKKWMTVSYSDTGKSAPRWNDATRDFANTERVMVIRNTFTDNNPKRELQVSGGAYSATFANYTTLTLPHSSGDVFQVYGVDQSSALRMPFNRADYYVYRPTPAPAVCAPNTGVLYKSVLNQGSNFTDIPLLDCVADMQVVYGMGQAGSNEVNFHQTTLTGTAQDIRQQLKEIRIYILAQQGKKDTNYKHPNSQIAVGESFGGALMGRTFDLPSQIGTGWDNYRWKVYTIVVRPQNLIQ
ncbi:type II secretion system GspH family protein [Geomonas paludis]|uniref:Type II secretion system GspH family protein n=1 Tax=Geomonas paludis TaxID=2740185 RepID=A0ABY4LJ61_9BACT|nr:PilW family protein [Geomonas paludis]UPU37560.1 type II secretion system GspH family protein [Geomonas paludis]